MERLSISTWNITLYDQNNRQKWKTRKKNLLHYEGELYILSSAFHTTLEGYGSPPTNLYIGLDNRPVIHLADRLSDVTPHEPNSLAYKRIPVRTDGGFYFISLEAENDIDHFGEDAPHVAALRTAVEFIAEGADIGRVNNAFLTTAAEGSNGALVVSVPLKHSFDFWENYRLTTEITVGLRKMRFAK